MIKWFAYIVLLLIFAPCLSSAGKATATSHRYVLLIHHQRYTSGAIDTLVNKLKQQQEEEKKKIKEISKAKRQAKPEKIDEPGNAAEVPAPVKPKRVRRPEGMERPPEIPRRNEN